MWALQWLKSISYSDYEWLVLLTWEFLASFTWRTCRYDRYMSKVKGIGSPSKSPQQQQQQQVPSQQLPPPPQREPKEVSLIDLADEPPSAQLASLCMFLSLSVLWIDPSVTIIISLQEWNTGGKMVLWNIFTLYHFEQLLIPQKGRKMKMPTLTCLPSPEQPPTKIRRPGNISCHTCTKHLIGESYAHRWWIWMPLCNTV